MDRYEKTNIEKDYKIFANKIKNLKPYMIKLYKFGVIKPKVYLPNYAIEKDN